MMKSASGQILAVSIHSTPNLAASSADTNGSNPIVYKRVSRCICNSNRRELNKSAFLVSLTFIPKDCILVATSRPIRPKPIIARVFPCTSTPINYNNTINILNNGTLGPYFAPLPFTILYTKMSLGYVSSCCKDHGTCMLCCTDAVSRWSTTKINKNSIMSLQCKQIQ